MARAMDEGQWNSFSETNTLKQIPWDKFYKDCRLKIYTRYDRIKDECPDYGSFPIIIAERRGHWQISRGRDWEKE